jgi:hypothetical protein
LLPASSVTASLSASPMPSSSGGSIIPNRFDSTHGAANWMRRVRGKNI